MVWVPSSPSKEKGEDGEKYVAGYKAMEGIGEGSFAKVKKCEKDGELYAMKILRKMKLSKKRDYVKGPNGKMKVETAWDKVQSEINLLSTITECDTVAHLYAILNFEQKIYLIFDYCEGGACMEWYKEYRSYFRPETRSVFAERTAARLVSDSLAGLDHIHRLRICHRDIKPQNLLLRKGRCKITDFGVASPMDEENMLVKSGTDGTHCFFPPEYCGSQEADASGSLKFDGEKVDVWCLGVTLHAFLFGHIPFFRDCLATLFEAICEATYPVLPEFDNVSKECLEFMYLLLSKDVATRPRPVEAASHAWLKTVPALEEELQLVPSTAKPVEAPPPAQLIFSQALDASGADLLDEDSD